MTARSASRQKQEQMLEEILVRVKSMQDSIDSKEIAEILKEPGYRRALMEAERDVRQGRVRPLKGVLKGLRSSK